VTKSHCIARFQMYALFCSWTSMFTICMNVDRQPKKAHKAPVWDQAETVCRHCLQILTTKTIKVSTFRTNHFPILDQYVSRCTWGLSDVLGDLGPIAHPIQQSFESVTYECIIKICKVDCYDRTCFHFAVLVRSLWCHRVHCEG